MSDNKKHNLTHDIDHDAAHNVGRDPRSIAADAEGHGIPSWSIRRPIGTVMLTATLLILGFVFVGRLPVDLLPQIDYPQVRVNVSNPGVEPGVLEETWPSRSRRRSPSPRTWSASRRR
jgi:hypothetical protein